MTMLSRSACPAAIVLVILLAGVAAAQPADETRIPCTDDAMIVFDASGSMAGNTVQGLFSDKTRIDEVRAALAQVLPEAAKFRKIGLITYGPGPYEQCNVKLNFPPIPNATERIMSAVNALNPAGKTPLVAAVKQAAAVLDYHGTIVLVTDGEETCGGAPCALGGMLKAFDHLTVHVIGYQLRAFSWTGPQSILDVECLAKQTGGLYITAQNREDLVKAFEKTLGCPMMSSIWRSVALSARFARWHLGHKFDSAARLSFAPLGTLPWPQGAGGRLYTLSRRQPPFALDLYLQTLTPARHQQRRYRRPQ